MISTRTITGENLSDNLGVIGDGYTIIDCNLTQRKANTPILDGIKGLFFRGCNLKNCDLPEDAKIEECLVCHEDMEELSPEQTELAQKKMEIEQQAVEDYRVELRAQLADVATVEELPMKEDLQIATATKAVDMKPAPIGKLGGAEEVVL